ncbi:hypothetical protein EYF80_031637 [Liparis tanakae]|uniref:Uncharacterized protein n=1 Tax=Liparis tanakae TaxID=230148 RepID=A0A4Z2GZU0_9TELE|nr:hypothetical protein EYF80_031637 [Liparis tanakae]
MAYEDDDVQMVSESTKLDNMYRFAKAAVNVTGQAARQVRNSSSASEEAFHAKYGVAMMIGGTVFCGAVWSYTWPWLSVGCSSFLGSPCDQAGQKQEDSMENYIYSEKN